MKAIIGVLFTITSFSLIGQNQAMMRTIEVTGTSERTTTPDEIIFTIGIEEYWEEEFEGKKPNQYKTKVPIGIIEESLIKELEGLGVTMKDITLKQAGNYWRQRGKDFLISKSLEISLKDFAKANEIASTIRTRGVRNMNVGQLKHSEIEDIKLEVKAEAIQAAKEKADKLAAVLGKKVKDVVSIVEIDQYAGTIPRPQNVAYARTAAMSADAGGGADYENFRKIKTKASVRIVFELE